MTSVKQTVDDTQRAEPSITPCRSLNCSTKKYHLWKHYHETRSLEKAFFGHALTTSRPEVVGVGMAIAAHPLHGSQRAEFPHWALASGGNAKRPRRERGMDAGKGAPAGDESPHPVPKYVAVLPEWRWLSLVKPRLECHSLRPQY